MALRRSLGRRTNLARVNDCNDGAVLELVRSAGAIARPATAPATGLTRQTVSNIAGRLSAAGAAEDESVRRGLGSNAGVIGAATSVLHDITRRARASPACAVDGS